MATSDDALARLADWIDTAPDGAMIVDVDDEPSRVLLEDTFDRIRAGELLTNGSAGGAEG